MVNVSIPATQTACVVDSHALKVDKEFPVTAAKDLAPGECLVKISHTGVCHTDLHAKNGDWPIPTKTPLIGGHEGIGEIVAIGEHTSRSPVKVGDRVGIKWLADSCLDCEYCRKGFEMNCVEAKLSGYTVDGTFAQYVVSYVHHVTPIPEGIASPDAASILCAGVTVYKALKNSFTVPGDWVVIPGAGGGLGHLAVQYAKNMGLKVVAVDTGDSKKALVEKLGADAWVDFKATKNLVQDVIKATGNAQGANAAIIASPAPAAYTQAIEYLRPGATLVCVGLAEKSMELTSFWVTVKSIRVQGSYVGTRQDAIESLAIAADGKVKVIYELKKFDDLKQVYEDMEAGKIAGRIVLEA